MELETRDCPTGVVPTNSTSGNGCLELVPECVLGAERVPDEGFGTIDRLRDNCPIPSSTPSADYFNQVPPFDIVEIARRIASRSQSRPEAELQADIRNLILTGGLQVDESQVVAMEVPMADGTRRRIDIEAGLTVIEVKRDLRIGNTRADAEEQLRGYVADRSASLDQRYVGILTDGADWYLYFLQPDGYLLEVATFHLDSSDPDTDALVVWLDGAMATQGDVTPTSREIAQRLGSNSPAYRLDFANLLSIYESCEGSPEVSVKRELWAKLLTTAFGANFDNDDDLFVNHTYLVLVACCIAHAVLGLPLATVSPKSIVRGLAFEQAGIHGVVEADFFDWLLETPDGTGFISRLSRRIARFSWDEVQHDVLKILYESVISSDVRHRLGEYYTPDWLAEKMVLDTVPEPLETRVLDPSCGSGTFLFWAVKNYLVSAESVGMDNGSALAGLTSKVFGADVHPVAVALARVTYLLAIGTARLKGARGSIFVPVFLGDSMQWGQQHGAFTDGAIRIPTSEQATLFTTELVFPAASLNDAGKFDQLVRAMTDRAAQVDGSRAKAIGPMLSRHGVGGSDAELLSQTYKTMCDLVDAGRNHIWGYYVRNLVRPLWLSLPQNRVDALVGNPPWLSYRRMTSEMQEEFRRQSQERRLWTGRNVANVQDLSGYFVVRTVELYLRNGGRFGFVMPNSVLSRGQYEGFRSGDFGSAGNPELAVSFTECWDLHALRPQIFPVPSAVVSGSRTDPVASPIVASDTKLWTARLPGHSPTWEQVEAVLTIGASSARAAPTESASLYGDRFLQGSNLVPRMLLCVRRLPVPPMGLPQGSVGIRSARSSQEKVPWKTLPSLEGVIENEFLRPAHLGSTIAPFRALHPWEVVIPWDGRDLMSGESTGIDDHPGLAQWWRTAEDIWESHKGTGTRLTLNGQINYMNKLVLQLATTSHRVVYTTSGTTVAAARVEDSRAVIDMSLYWAAATLSEARYLTGILNSGELLGRVAPLQARGAFGRRHFAKYVFSVAIPLFDEGNANHSALVELSARAEEIAARVALETGTDFKVARTRIRDALAAEGTAEQIEDLVRRILPHRDV
jgi:hypothetical protein